ncbi:Phenylacetyl-ligase [Neofusicoccum parvum]|uniref:Phenylacetyl-ligase n=1 Tax=Neofusicoccum parvum TaxID=310453 RepID=A0ACB5SQT5_9PEZI|nr:Phenylacetyl-ligase [Neofusicoccum parvum]
MFDVQSGTKCYVPMTETAADSTTLSRIDDERKFSASYKGVDLAKRACMFQMMKIVREVDEITKKPGLATDETRGERFQSALVFADRLPKAETIQKAPASPLTAEVIKADDAAKPPPPLYDGDSAASLSADEQQKLKDLAAERPSLGETLRLGPLAGSPDAGDLFCSADFLKPAFALTQVRVDITAGAVSALHLQYANGLATHLGADAPGDKTAVLDLRPDLNEKVIACSVEVGRAAAAGDKSRARVTALRLHTNRGPGLLGQADDWRPAAAGGKGVRGGAAFEELALAHFDPALERGHLKGFWGRARNSSKPHPQAGLYRLGPVWGSGEGKLSGGAAAPPLDDEPAGAVVPAGVWLTAEMRPWDKPVTHTAAVVPYAAAAPDGPGVPAVVVGLACVDAMGAANLRCAAYAESVAPRDFAINVDSWADSQVYQAKLAWLGVPTGDAAKFQAGRFDTRAPVAHDIKFGRAFRKPPTVVVWLSGLDEEKNKGIRINAYASDTTAAGFKMHVDCWDKSVLYWASLSWVAFSEDTGVVAGSYKVDIGADLARKKQEGRALFPPGKFAKPPRVVAAFNHLDLNAFTAANVRVATEVEDVTVEGFKYSTSCWADSQLHYTTATWLALPSP